MPCRFGIDAGKCGSLETKIAYNKNLYYVVIFASQQGWCEWSNDSAPPIKIFLKIVIATYKDFEQRADITSEDNTALENVKDVITKQKARLQGRILLPRSKRFGKLHQKALK